MIKYKPYILLSICVITFICFNRSLTNQFTSWDDDVYIPKNPYIKALTTENLKAIFSENVTQNYYHPLTILSYALNFHFAGLSPFSYYLTNILLHLANVLLVFFLVSQLFSNLSFIDKNHALLASYLASLWFGIHPMHVESVSWIAERKDVLYTFFYLLGLIGYLKFLKSPGHPILWYLLTLLLFIASCFSKPMAVVFPLSLVCIDFLLNRKLDSKVVLEKIPFFTAAFILGYISYHLNKEVNSVTPFSNIPVTMRAMFATYGFVMYIAKFFLPLHLSTFYPYPCVNMELHVDMPLPVIFYISFYLAILIFLIPLWFTYKYNKHYFRVVGFGLGFFFFNIMFELQFISSGMALMADRYSYLSYLGLLFIAAFFIQEIITHFPVIKYFVFVLVSFCTLFLACLCYERTAVWQNSETLFKDAVEQYGDEASLFYKGLGEYYMAQGRNSESLDYFARYVRLNNDPEVFNDMGNLFKAQKDYSDAIKFYLKLLHSGGSIPTAYIKVSDVFAQESIYDSALSYYNKAIKLNANMEKLYANICTASVNAKQFQNAINHYTVLIMAYPENPYYYFYRGVAKFSEDSIKEAVNDFLMPLKLNSPKDVQASAAYNLAVAYDKLAAHANAFNYALIAKKYGQTMDTAFFNRLERNSR